MIGMTTWIMTEMFISHGREKKIELLLVYCERCVIAIDFNQSKPQKHKGKFATA